MSVKTIDEYTEEKDKKKRRQLVTNIILLALSVLIIGAVTIAVETGMFGKSDDGQGSTRDVQSVCKETDFPNECYQKLKYVGQRAMTIKYVKAGLDKTLEEMQPAMETENKDLDHLQPDQVDVLGDCLQLISTAAEGLREMIKWVESDKKFLQSNPEELRTGLSAVISSTQICLDELELMNSTSVYDDGNSLRTPLQTARITLAIVYYNSDNNDKKAYTHERSSNRKSLMTKYTATNSDNDNGKAFPTWMTGADRKLLEAHENGNLKPDVVVAKDGSGHYRSIGEAIDEYPLERNTRYVIYVREGIYSERVFIDSSVTQIFMYGDGPNNTIVSGYFDENSVITAFMGSTLVVFGHGFLCKDLTIAAVDGPFQYEYSPAVRVHADKSAFFNTVIRGDRGGLFAGAHRQFYRDCEILGGGPVLKGDAAAVIQNSQILLNPTKTTNVVSEHLRSDKNENTGFVIHNCSIGINSEYDETPSRKTYKNPLYASCLGRPGKEFSRTVIMESYLPDIIKPQGWCQLRDDYGVENATFLEYNNNGNGAKTDKRINWSSFGIIEDVEEARRYTPGRFINADNWLKSSGIPYFSGLVSDGGSA